jgi:hypothetical protein
MTEEEIFYRVRGQMWTPPLSTWLDSGALRTRRDPLSRAMLVAWLLIEVEMGGLMTYLTNSSGEYAREAVGALDEIGAGKESLKIAKAVDVLDEVLITQEAVEAQRAQYLANKGAVGSFNDVHPAWTAATRTIGTIEDEIDFEEIQSAACRYCTKHSGRILPLLAALS